MQRRTFFKWTFFSWVGQLLLPTWANGQNVTPAETDAATLRALAGVVLPAALGDTGITAATARFRTWVREYKAGAEMSAGYGFTQIQNLPDDPSASYPQQLQDLERAARVRGRSFAALTATDQQAIVDAALTAARVDALPRRPNGKHVAADLMSHFFFVSSEGQDWLYNASIRRETCRGLGSSGERPSRIR